MNTSSSSCEQFTILSEQLCSLFYTKQSNLEKINSLIDELNALPYKSELFIRKNDVISLLNVLCLYIKPVDEFMSAKASHLMNSIVTKQNLQLSNDQVWRVISWHIDCVKTCSDVVLPDILHNLQCILHDNVQAGYKYINELIGKQGLLLELINIETKCNKNTQNISQIALIVLKAIVSLMPAIEDRDKHKEFTSEIKENIADIVIKYLMKGSVRSDDEFLYCKIVIAALRVLAHIYFNFQMADVPLPELMGICQYFTLYGLLQQKSKPEKILPAQQTIAEAPVKPCAKGGKKQKVRKQRNSAIESLKKEIPVSDRSLMKDVDNFENNSAYKPASKNYLEPLKAKTCWALTSDSDVSDVESSREAKLIALKSRVRQSAANLFLVLLKIKDKKDIFGYWWALLPNSPDVNNWLAEENSKKTLAYCAVTDPIASSRASALSVILAILSGSKMYLAQAEGSKKQNASFIPFSVSLGYVINCMHKILVGILDGERSHAVIIVALKCCAALVQATPYHKMETGLVSQLVKSTRKFLVHRDITLQVGALITMGCVLSIDPKVDEVLSAIRKDIYQNLPQNASNKENKPSNDDCDDFEEGYSDDEMFTVDDTVESSTDNQDGVKNVSPFDTWILDICFRNIGWIIRGNERISCKPSVIPVILESLQVLSAIAFHHLAEVLRPHTALLADVLSDMLAHEHQDVVVQTARLVSVVGDAIQKLEQTNEAPPVAVRVYMWSRLLTPLSCVLQGHNAPAKAVACDCIANIGEKAFEELPARTQTLCCALLVGSCSDEEAGVRAAAVRALAMAVMYRSLRQDICFVSDCAENILSAVRGAGGARAKAAWALANLSDALVINEEDPDVERLDDDLLLRLLEVSVECAADNDKVKMSACRALGNLLRLVRASQAGRARWRAAGGAALAALVRAARAHAAKVRWNACRALGNAMRNDTLFQCFSGWQEEVFQTLGELCASSPNLKVRASAAAAARAGRRAQYGAHFAALWARVAAALQPAADVHDYSEYRHKDNLIEQLCVTLAHMCCLLTQSDLADILDPLIFHFDCAKSLFAQLYQKLPPENPSCMKILQAAKYVTMDLTAATDAQMQSLSMLQEIFIWDV